MKSNLRAALPALSFLIAFLTLSACASTPIEPDAVWREAEVEAPSDTVLWKIALLSTEQLGFPVAGGLNPSSGEIVTGWNTILQPFRGKGTRRRAEVHMEVLGKRRWLVRTRVQTQLNMSLVAPLDPTRAEWEWGPEDALKAEVLLRRIVAVFEPVLELNNGSEKPAGTR